MLIQMRKKATNTIDIQSYGLKVIHYFEILKIFETFFFCTSMKNI